MVTEMEKLVMEVFEAVVVMKMVEVMVAIDEGRDGDDGGDFFSISFRSLGVSQKT